MTKLSFPAPAWLQALGAFAIGGLIPAVAWAAGVIPVKMKGLVFAPQRAPVRSLKIRLVRLLTMSTSYCPVSGFENFLLWVGK